MCTLPRYALQIGFLSPDDPENSIKTPPSPLRSVIRGRRFASGLELTLLSQSSSTPRALFLGWRNTAREELINPRGRTS